MRAGLKGISENITVRSIVGFYLEHARIFYFLNDGKEEYYLASSDWMPRNLERRVELLFPVERPELREKLHHILDLQLRDTAKAHIMDKNGDYQRIDRRGKETICAQLEFSKEAKKVTDEAKSQVTSGRVFIPEKGQTWEQ